MQLVDPSNPSTKFEIQGQQIFLCQYAIPFPKLRGNYASQCFEPPRENCPPPRVNPEFLVSECERHRTVMVVDNKPDIRQAQWTYPPTFVQGLELRFANISYAGRRRPLKSKRRKIYLSIIYEPFSGPVWSWFMVYAVQVQGCHDSHSASTLKTYNPSNTH